MKALLYFTITAIFWGLNFHLAKVMLLEVRFIEAGFWRYLFGVIPLIIYAYKQLPTWNIILNNIRGILLVGVAGLFGFNVFFFLGLQQSAAINGALIISLTPALTLLFSNQILKTKILKKEFLGIIISFIGVLYLILKGNLNGFSEIDFSWGDIFLLGSATLFGIQNVWIKQYGTGLSNKHFTLLTNLFCLISFAIIVPFIGISDITTYSHSFWLSSIGIGVFGTSVAYLLWNAGIQLSSPNQAGIFINVVPLSAATFSVLFGEALETYHFISGLFIIVGVMIIMVKRKSS